MTKGKRYKSRKYEEYYGETYTPKTLKEVKVCSRCGRTLTEGTRAKACPFCGGTLITKYIKKKKAGNPLLL